jgi:hypothetical protein
MQRLLFYLLALFILLAACHKDHPAQTETARTNQPGDNQRSPDASIAVPTNILRSGPQLTEAFNAAFGQSPPATAALNPEKPDKTYEFLPSALISTRNNFFLLSSARNLEDCHACSGGLIVHLFNKSGESRGSVVHMLRFVEGGSGFGNAAEWTLRTDLFNSPALLVQYGFMAQGCIVGGVDIYEMTESKLAKRAQVLTEQGSPSQDATEGQIQAGTRGESFTVHYTGAFQKTVTFTRAGEEEYSSDTPASALPAC